MLTLEDIKGSINDPSLTDEDIKNIRDELYEFVEIVFKNYTYKKNADINVKHPNILSTVIKKGIQGK